jgi:hypothetical protein
MSKTQDTPRNPFAKNTYRVINEPFKLLGILDWRYALCAVVPSVFFGLAAHSKIAGLILFAVLAWRAWEMQEDDPNLPLVWWVTLFQIKHADGFGLQKGKK